MLVFAGATGTAPSAVAGVTTLGPCPFANADDAGKNNASEVYRSGVDSLTPALSPISGKLEQSRPLKGASGFNGKPVTAYEYYGTSGAFWSVATEDCWGAAKIGGNMMANQMLSGTKAITSISIGMFQWASSPNLMADFAKPMDAVVKGLKKNLYLNFLSPIVVLGALWMAWQGLVKKRTTEATQGAVWMIGSAIFALVFMAWPSLIATQANNLVSTVNSTAMTAVTGATSNAISKSDICYLPKSAPKAGIRSASCSIYKALVYTPWAAGQFGVSPGTSLSASKGSGGNYARVTIPGHGTVTDLRVAQLEAQATNASEAARVSNADNAQKASVRQKIVDADAKRFDAIQERAKKEAWAKVWTGDDIGARINVAFASLIASLCAGALVLVISFASIVLALGMLMLIMVAPLFLLIGAHPGFGRGIALKWLELLLGTVVKRIVLGFLLAILIGFYQVILATSMAWFSQIALIVAVGIGAIMYRKPMLEAMNIINLGGSKSGLEGQDFNRHAKKGAAGAIGMAAGGATAARSGYLNGGTKGALAGALGGAMSGGMMGARSGNPLRAAQMGSGAGRRAASRQESSRDKKARMDDPFAYDAAEKKEAKQAAHLQSMADQYADDPEMQRRLEAWAKKNDRPVPRPGAVPAKGSDGGDSGGRDDDGPDGPSGPPPSGTGSSTPRPGRGGASGATTALPVPPVTVSGGAPRGTGTGPASPTPDEADTRRLDKVERDQVEARGNIDELNLQQAKAQADLKSQDLAARTLARVRQQAERDGKKPTPPGAPNTPTTPRPPTGGNR